MNKIHELDPERKVKSGSEIRDVITRFGGRHGYCTWFFKTKAERLKSGCLVVHGLDDFNIMLSTDTNYKRDTWTLVKLLGHYILHSLRGEKPLVTYSHEIDHMEREANHFAINYLLPKDDFIRLYNHYGREPWRMSHNYGFPEDLVKIRAEEISSSCGAAALG